MLHVALRGFGPNSPQSMPNQLALKTMGEIMMNEMIQVEQHWHTVLNVEKLSASRVLKSARILRKEGYKVWNQTNKLKMFSYSWYIKYNLRYISLHKSLITLKWLKIKVLFTILNYFEILTVRKQLYFCVHAGNS